MTDPAEYSKLLIWAEEHGIKNLQEKFTTGDTLNKEAQTTLTILLAGIGGSLTYVVKAVDPAEPMTAAIFGVSCFCAYLTVLAVVLAISTLLFSPYPSVHQDPANLLEFPNNTLDEIRRAELEAMSQRIAEAIAWNSRKGRLINAARVGLSFAPLVFLLAAWYHSPPSKTPSKPTLVKPSSQPSSQPSLQPSLLTPSSQPSLQPSSPTS